MFAVATTQAYEAEVDTPAQMFHYHESYNAVAVDFTLNVSDERNFVPGRIPASSRLACSVHICVLDDKGDFSDIAVKKMNISVPYADFEIRIKTFVPVPSGELISGRKYIVRVYAGNGGGVGSFYLVDWTDDDKSRFKIVRAGLMHYDSDEFLRTFRGCTVAECEAFADVSFAGFDSDDSDWMDSDEVNPPVAPYRARYAVFDAEVDWDYPDELPDCTMLFLYADGEKKLVRAEALKADFAAGEGARPIRFKAVDPRPEAPCGPVYVALNFMNDAIAAFVAEKVAGDADEERGEFEPGEMAPIWSYDCCKGLARLEKARAVRASMPKAESDTADTIRKLEKMVGLRNVKSKVRRYMSLMAFHRMRADKGIASKMPPLHALFLGAPGTGKSSMAELMGRLMKEAGVLSKGHVVVRERSQIVGRHYGDESEAMRKALEEAEGGVLFIDEAYNLYRECDPKDPGREAIETLLTALADPRRRDWMLILGGYEDRILKMFDMNPGLASRFPVSNRYRFEDYSAEELIAIAENFCEENAYSFSPEAREKLYAMLLDDVKTKDETFGNARHVLNLMETEILPAMAERVAAMTDVPDDQILTLILPEDIPLRSGAQPGPRRPGLGFRA